MRPALYHLAQNVIGHGAVAFFDSVHANLIRELDCGAHPCQCRNIGAANTLKSFRAQLRVVPAFRRDRAPNAVDHFIAYV